MKAALAYLEEVAKRVLFAILFLVGLGFVRWAVAVRALACGTFLLRLARFAVKYFTALAFCSPY